jgi:hypothetical protein
VQSLSVKSIFDANTNYIYNVFTKKGANDNALFIYKTNFGSFICNEGPLSSSTSSIISTCLTYTTQFINSTVNSNINIVRQSKGFINDDACLTITGINKQQATDNELILKSLPNNEFQIQSKSYLINQIVVYDMLGKKVISNSFKDYNATINLHDYTNGLYFINIKCSNGNETTFKVIKGD